MPPGLVAGKPALRRDSKLSGENEPAGTSSEPGRDAEKKTPARGALTRTVVGLGVVSLCTDAASDMVWPLLPVLLAESMHQSVAYAGVIEGIADAVAAFVKYSVGKRSDQLARRKPFVLAGYALSSLVRPLLALATLPAHALGIRVLDRIGKGLRSAPRDALLAEDTAPERRAIAFGFHRAMDNLGAVLGPLAALAVLAYAKDDVRAVAWATAVPGALAVLAVVFLVRERGRDPNAPATAPSPAKDPSRAAPLPVELRRYLTVVAVFSLANASDVFIVAQARRAGVSIRDTALLWAALSAVRAVGTTPGGALAERIGRRRALQLGWTLYAVAYLAFPLVKGAFAVLLVTLVYGAYYGLTEGAEKAIVGSYVDKASLGRAYGAFALVTGIGSLAASLLFAALFTVGDGRWSFWLAAALALVAAAALSLAPPPRDAAR
jgi:MFS family permease